MSYQEDKWNDLFDILPDNVSMEGYCVNVSTNFNCNYLSWESNVEKLLVKEGYKEIRFYTADGDSFGPLVRGVYALDPSGNKVRYFYG